jgi:predicted phosphodiesterase
MRQQRGAGMTPRGAPVARIAVLADIHGNLAALEAVADDIDRWAPDAVVVAGDIVNRGPQSAECLALIQQRRRDGWLVMRGNHEGYVLDVAGAHQPRQGLEEEIRRSIAWTCRQLGDVTPLAALPDRISLGAPDGGEVRVVHASMRHDRDNILPGTPDAELREQIAPAPAVLAVGHTHVPLVRTIDRTLVVNAGSVGMPFDGDLRASYAQLAWGQRGWQARIVRVAYDRAATDRAFTQSGFFAVGAAAWVIYDEFCSAEPRLSTWLARYQRRVVAGELSVAAALDRFRSGSEHTRGSS